MLFSPGSRPAMMQKAARAGADALIFDLEDSVAPAARIDARKHVRDVLGEAGPPVFVRVNHPSTGETAADLEALAGDRVHGVILPKADTAEDVRALDRLLDPVAKRLPRPIAIVPMVESCLALRNAFEVANASERVAASVFASAEEGDFIVDLGGRWTPEGQAMLYPRSRHVCESRAAGIEALVDGVFMNLEDDEALRRECALARTLGYTGKMAIHPRQVAIMNEAFTPGAAEIEHARALIAAYREAAAKGQGALQFRGMMVDYANVRRAERIVAIAARLAG